MTIPPYVIVVTIEELNSIQIFKIDNFYSREVAEEAIKELKANLFNNLKRSVNAVVLWRGNDNCYDT